MQETEKIQDFDVSKNYSYTEGTLFVNQADIEQLKGKLELKSGSKLNVLRSSSLEVVLACQNINKYQCGFKYLFRKHNEDPEKLQYFLVTEFQSHHLECLDEAAAHSKPASNFIASPSFKRYKPEIEEDIQAVSPKMFFLGYSGQINQAQKVPKQLQQEFMLLQNKHANKLYTEQEVTTLKKELQFQSKGLISKSTEFHSQLGYITKISFKCKHEYINCPYLATLTYTYERNNKNQKLYRLQKTNKQHHNSCILDDQDIHYNVVTRKIDQNMNTLIKILQQNSKDIKPKRVLELFAQSLEEEADFIYNGIASKINRRAVKKYFDNSVAKARNMLK